VPNRKGHAGQFTKKIHDSEIDAKLTCPMRS
jgi:hypothetical protein